MGICDSSLSHKEDPKHKNLTGGQRAELELERYLGPSRRSTIIREGMWKQTTSEKMDQRLKSAYANEAKLAFYRNT